MNEPMPVGEESANRKYPETSPQGRALLAKYFYSDPWAVLERGESSDLAKDEKRIAVYATNEHPANPDRTALRSLIVRLPEGVKSAEIYPAPGRDRILYAFCIQSMSELNNRLHKLVPAYHPAPRRLESLWISDANGRNLREIASQPVRDLEKDDALLQNVQWSPDGKRISFSFERSLYLLPIPAEPAPRGRKAH
jgi:hypothetical protein